MLFRSVRSKNEHKNNRASIGRILVENHLLSARSRPGRDEWRSQYLPSIQLEENSTRQFCLMRIVSEMVEWALLRLFQFRADWFGVHGVWEMQCNATKVDAMQGRCTRGRGRRGEEIKIKRDERKKKDKKKSRCWESKTRETSRTHFWPRLQYLGIRRVLALL